MNCLPKKIQFLSSKRNKGDRLLLFGFRLHKAGGMRGRHYRHLDVLLTGVPQEFHPSVEQIFSAQPKIDQFDQGLFVFAFVAKQMIS